MDNHQTKKPLVTLCPMSKDAYQLWLDHCTLDYAKDKMSALEIPEEEALDLSRQSFRTLLPNGLETVGHYLHAIVDAHEMQVGTLWFAIQTQWGITSAFIYDLEIDPDQRRRGYAHAAIVSLENEVISLGASRIGLHVFGRNHGAKSLYDQLGYQVTDISMAKTIGQKSADTK